MAQRPNADDLKRLWKLSVMPTEKVYFTQSYVDPKTGADGKPLCSATIALLTDDPSTFSDMHRLPTDEIWHFYLGDPIDQRPLPRRQPRHPASLPARRRRRPGLPRPGLCQRCPAAGPRGHLALGSIGRGDALTELQSGVGPHSRIAAEVDVGSRVKRYAVMGMRPGN